MLCPEGGLQRGAVPKTLNPTRCVAGGLEHGAVQDRVLGAAQRDHAGGAARPDGGGPYAVRATHEAERKLPWWRGSLCSEGYPGSRQEADIEAGPPAAR